MSTIRSTAALPPRPQPTATGDALGIARQWHDAGREGEPDHTGDAAAFDDSMAPPQLPGQGQCGVAPAAAGARPCDGGAQLAGDEFGLADALAPLSDSAIFELLLADGETLAVSVDVRAAGVKLLLVPSSDKLRTRLETQHMELEGVLKRRMGRGVNIAIL